MTENLQNYLRFFPEVQRFNYLREYLQWLILKGIDQKGYRRQMAFMGGTSLRILYHSNRFSEDLNFSLTIPRDHFKPAELRESLKNYFNFLGLEIEISPVKTSSAVASFFIKFPHLLYYLHLSPQKEEKISIKIEVDTNPPSGWKLEEFLMTDPFLFWITHYDLPSLFASRLHAFLFRKYDKGRDYYDLLFLLRRKTDLNFQLFQNAVKQTHPEKKYSSVEEVYEEIKQKIVHTNFQEILKDARPFILDAEELQYLNPDVLIKLLEQST
jgi:predicted nucleotidyltransferase component of viral defense system